MANPFRGEVAIAGGAYRLVCDFNALCEIEAAFDGDIDAALGRIDSGSLTLQEQRSVVAALLRHHWPGVSEREAGEVISQSLTGIHAAIIEAIARAMPEEKPGKKPARRRTAQG